MIGITVPFHLRGGTGKTIAPVFSYLSKLRHTVVLCGSEGDTSFGFAMPYLNRTTHYAEVPQVEPVIRGGGGSAILRQKFSDSLIALGQIGVFDWYCLVGANDAVSPHFFDDLDRPRAPNAPPTVAGITSQSGVGMLEGDLLQHVNIRYANKVHLAPGVNAFNRAALDSCNWHPYRLPNCEVGMESTARQLKWRVVTGPGTIIQIKGERDLNTSAYIRRAHDITEPTPKELAWYDYLNQNGHLG